MLTNVQEAKTHFSKLLERAHAGEEVIISKAGKPYAKLVPLEPVVKPKRVPGGLEFEVPDSFFDPLPEEDLRVWEGG